MSYVLFMDRDGIEKCMQADGDGSADNPFLLIPANRRVSLGAGEVANRAHFCKFGNIKSMNTVNTNWDVWNGQGLYTGFPTGAAEEMEIASSNVADTAAGTGARTVEISGLLDGTGAEMPAVTVTLNGTTQVSLGAQTYYRGSRMKVKTAGSGGENVGILTLRHKITTANIFAKMPAGSNQTTIACSTVPLGKTLYLLRTDVSMARANGSAGSADITLKVKPHGGVFNNERDTEITNSMPYTFDNNVVIKMLERTDFKVNVSGVSDNGTNISAELGGELVTN